LRVGLYQDRALTKLLSKIELQTLPTFDQNTFSSLEFCGIDMIMQKPKIMSLRLENYSFYGSPNSKQICPKKLEKVAEKITEVAPIKDQKPNLIPQQQTTLVPKINLESKTQPNFQAQKQPQLEKISQKQIESNFQAQPKIANQVIPQNALVATNYNFIMGTQKLQPDLSQKIEINTSVPANSKIIQKTNLSNDPLKVGSQNLDLVSSNFSSKRFLDNSVIGVSSDVFNILLSTLFLALITKKVIKKVNLEIFKIYRLLFQFKNMKIVADF
jgi:hypothetical protein